MYEMSKKVPKIDISQLKAMSDAEVLSLSVSRPQVFEELVDRYQRLLLRKARSILRNEDDASDVVQDTFVRIYTSASKFKKQEGASFSSWAYTILTHQCYTYYRKKQKHAFVSLEMEPALADVIPDRAAIEAVEEKFTRDHIIGLIAKLPAIMRRVVELHFIRGVPQKEIAREEGVSLGVVRSRVFRAKKELQKLDLAFARVSTAGSLDKES